MALVPTVIGVGEEESRQDERNGEASQDDGLKMDYIYSLVPTVIGMGEQESSQDGA